VPGREEDGDAGIRVLNRLDGAGLASVAPPRKDGTAIRTWPVFQPPARGRESVAKQVAQAALEKKPEGVEEDPKRLSSKRKEPPFRPPSTPSRPAHLFRMVLSGMAVR